MSHQPPGSASHRSQWSRRAMLISSTAVGLSSAFGLALASDRSEAMPHKMAATDTMTDITILNNALYYEHQAIWAYGFAATKLTNTSIGQAVLAVALANQADHQQHRDLLAAAVRRLGGQPVAAETSYDVSSYLKKREGNLDSDVNIAKLALALETDAAIAYTKEVARLKTPELITAGASIGSAESAHAAAIRATFKALGVDLKVVPSAFVSAANRQHWVLMV